MEQGAQLECHQCGNPTSFHRRFCHVCEADIGFPNVRQAQSEDVELRSRYDAAIASLEHRNLSALAKSFESVISTESRAVLASTVPEFIRLLNSENELYTTFAKKVDGAMKIAQDNAWDRLRDSVEAALFPRYWGEIRFSALSLEDTAVEHYGKVHLTLKSQYISNRSSVFEENPFLFMKKHDVIVGAEVPKGYRTTWESRGKLAVVKLHDKLSSNINYDDYKSLLISDGEDPERGDFIEVHTYGSLNIKTFSRVTFIGLDDVEKCLIEVQRKQMNDSGLEIV